MTTPNTAAPSNAGTGETGWSLKTGRDRTGFFTFTTLVCRTRVFCTCRRTSKLSPVCSWTQTPSQRTGRLLYKVMRSLRMVSTWRTAPVRAAPTGLRSGSCAWTALYFWRTDWRGSNSPACPGLTTERDSSITLILSRRARATFQLPIATWVRDLESVCLSGTETSTNLHQKLYYHVLGTPQSQDVLCAEFPDQPKWMSGAEVSDDGRYVLLSIREGCDPVNRLWYCDLNDVPQGITGLLPWVKLIDNFDAEYEYVTNEGTVFTFKTNLDAPQYRLINVDFAQPSISQWKELIPQHDKDVIVFATCTYSKFLFVCFLHDVKNVLKMFHLSSGEEIRTFPLDVGSIVGFTGRKKDSEIFYSFTSFLSPAIIYHCDLTKEPLQPHVFREVTVKGFSPADYQTTQVFYPSKDGTQIPMFIVHKKGIELDGSHPAFLYGYGGFNISITPSYSVSRLIFVRHLGGVLAVANIRGGGEYGETWHKAGMLANKQNCFTDFQCAAEYLIKEGYTSPNKITINGGSNGGLLVAACVNQRPDLFGCAVAQVGVMDMLKFHKFTIGHAWTTDFGCSEIKEQFDWLIKYSPLHNIHVPEADGVQYPAILLLTGDHDDRVVPLHSLKYIATLQNVIGQLPGQSNPLFIYVDTKSGHGAGKPTSKVIQEVADTYAFIARCLNLSWIE
uniref:Prolyl endopeptidase n=1 Tax=Cyprinus carpio carpio TaxID=630221 RepID=A0A9J8AI76_CYPCA